MKRRRFLYVIMLLLSVPLITMAKPLKKPLKLRTSGILFTSDASNFIAVSDDDTTRNRRGGQDPRDEEKIKEITRARRRNAPEKVDTPQENNRPAAIIPRPVPTNDPRTFPGRAPANGRPAFEPASRPQNGNGGRPQPAPVPGRRPG